MHRPRRRRTLVRIIGWGLVAVAYAAVLVWAAELSVAAGSGAPAQAGQQLAGALSAAPVDVEPVTMASASVVGERPLVTLAIAATMVSAAFASYLVHSLRTGRRAARKDRLIFRHITTLF